MKYTFLIYFALFCTVANPVPAAGQNNNGNFAEKSVLISGRWFKIAVIEEGIYKITWSALKEAGLKFPGNPRLYGNNYGQLSFYNSDPSPDDLKEISIMTVTGSDGIFNEGDYLLFYAQGTSGWRYDQSAGKYIYKRHYYSDTAFYFITSAPSPGKQINSVTTETDQPGYSSYSYDALHRHEKDAENLIKSGREWFQPVSSLNGIAIKPGFSDIILSEGISFRFRVLGRSSVPSMFRLYEGETLHSGVLVPEVDMFSTTGTYAREETVSGTIIPSSSSPSFEIRFYNNGQQGAKGWLDYAELQGRASTVFTGKMLLFSDAKSAAPGRITEFNVKSSSATMTVWEITDPFNPQIIPYIKSGDYCTFRLKTDSLRKFIAFTSDQAKTPLTRMKPVANQNLHGSDPADMIIVTHPLFYNYARKLADFHYNNSGLISLIVTPEEIYNEFSGGIPDVPAIRNFLRMKFKKGAGTSRPLKYLLLFGDGSYDNRKMPPINPNFVPTYQSLNSNVVISSFVSDDFYGLLEDGEGEANGTEDLGIGRMPASDTLQASIMVEKVIKYSGVSAGGDWRNLISIIADDEDGNSHMNDAEGLASLISDEYPEFNVDKIYLDAFRQVTSINGQSYPDVEQAINSRINSGCLIFNYVGHGNEVGLAHERVVKTQSINSWRNGSKLPLFITATCEFARFDDAEFNPFTGELTGRNSAGEMVLFNRDGGGIALMSTTRVVYSAPNYTLNRNILSFVFQKDSAGEALRLGDIMRLAKNNSGSGMNKRNFTLLGDPALRLAYPSHGRVVTDSVNGISISSFTDTLKALSFVTVSGHIEDNKGNLMNGFEGLVYPVVYDKIRKIKTLANDGGQTMEFRLQNSVIFSGKIRASKGMFSFSFIVSRDIDYSYGKGKISYYAIGSGMDMNGYYNQFTTGGFSNIIANDTTGPDIRLFLNDTLFRNGDISGTSPLLIALISDKSGINTSGAGIGHDLTAWLNGDINTPFVLNSYFETMTGNYGNGIVKYPLYDLPEGPLSITLRAWDNYNNSSTATLKFIVKTDKGFLINNLINYPNPFAGQTYITGGHNRPGENLELRIEIFDMSGKKVRVIEENCTTEGYRLPPVEWDGTLEGGKRAARGIYSYVVTVRTGSGEISKASGKMVIL